MKKFKGFFISIIIQIVFAIIAIVLGYFFPSWDKAFLWFFGYMAGMIVIITLKNDHENF